MTHEEYIAQLKEIKKAKLPPTQALECQLAFSFVEYLQRFENYETRTAQRLILDILKKNNVQVILEVAPHPDEPLAWIDQVNNQLKRRGLFEESRAIK